jgi:tetratricopeptide (TPR) repeat protein
MPSMTKFKFAPMLLVMFALAGQGAESLNEVLAGRSSYNAGDYKKAAAHFNKAVKADPNDAAAYYWLGRSYALTGDLSAPIFGNRTLSKARTSFAKAVELAPANPDFRREYFNFLLWTDESKTALGQAQSVLNAMPESDPDYRTMQWELREQRNERKSAENRVAGIFLSVPKAVIRVVDQPMPVVPVPQSAFVGK